ncbi:MAG: site-2 protease family protein [Candidatus Hodarchaeota archaeon]
MSQNDEWKKIIRKEYEKRTILDRLHLSVHEISELGIGWLISSFVILYITGTLKFVIQEGRIPDTLLIYLFILGISFFFHELTHKFTAIKYGARAQFKLSREALMITIIGLIIGFPVLATGAVYWWGEAAASPGIRGRVSAAGPVSNLILAGIFFVIQGIGIAVFTESTTLGILLFTVGFTGVWLNAFLGVFNMIPFGMLDGAKVLAWDPKIWVSIIGSLIAIGFISGGFGWFL